MMVNSCDLFLSLRTANQDRYWNLNVLEAFEACHLIGTIYPSSLLITGPVDQLGIIKRAWNKRLLKPPAHFAIAGVGE